MGFIKKLRFWDRILESLFLTSLLLFPALSHASEKVDITGIRYWSYPDYTRVVIDLSGNTEFVKNRLSNPDRLYFDIQNSTIKKDLQTNISIGNGMLRSVRAGQFNSDTVRVVLDLEKINNYKVFTLEDPVRVIVDIYGTAIFSLKKRIVIDPGHGGHDPGAVGPNKLYEKDVVLDIALKLRKILSENPDYEIFLTRDKDIFIPLEERTAIANSKNADLFVSVHANASPRRDAKGIETYLLNWTNDEEAMKVAARENQISLKKMKKMQKGMDALDIILSDLSRGYKRDESIKLANYVQRSMVSELDRNYRHIVDLGIKQALFYVLLGAEMPSVLVEVSFISNPSEEKLLSKDDYRSDLASSIASGINKYMSGLPEGQTIAGIGKTFAP
ncbi:MAG: N-acetylmuramoyl-L-alanine amidase [Nitrospirota bacterium]